MLIRSAFGRKIKLPITHDAIGNHFRQQRLVIATRLVAGNVLPAMLHENGADVLVLQFNRSSSAIVQLAQKLLAVRGLVVRLARLLQ